MKNLGKIGIAAGLATAVFILLRKRNDGTRLLDDITHQVSKWANTLMEVGEKLGNKSDTAQRNGAMPRTAPRTSAASRQAGDIQE